MILQDPLQLHAECPSQAAGVLAIATFSLAKDVFAIHSNTIQTCAGLKPPRPQVNQRTSGLNQRKSHRE
jgi:hypothetical protein